MKYCKNCEKETPSKVIGDKEECMVCGAEIVADSKKPENFMNRRMMKELKELKILTKTDKDTGKYTNSQIIGRNLLIGVLIIIAGILYSMGGITLVLSSAAAMIIGLVLLAIILYIIAMVT